MPNFNGMGPMGAGPMTGRGMGPCGCGRGFGRARGFGGFWRQPTAEDLKSHKQLLEEELSAVDEELKRLQK